MNTGAVPAASIVNDNHDMVGGDSAVAATLLPTALLVGRASKVCTLMIALMVNG